MILGMEYSDFLEIARSSIQNRIHVGEGSFETYRENVEKFKAEHPDIIKQYGLTESELFVMFMMLIRNNDEIQQCASLEKGTQFIKECVHQYDSFLSKIPISTNSVFYRADMYTRIENFEKRAFYVCEHFLTASISPSIFDNYQNCVKLIINKRIIGNSKAHDVFRVFEIKGEKQVNFERNTKFQISNIDKTNKIVELTEI